MFKARAIKIKRGELNGRPGERHRAFRCGFVEGARTCNFTCRIYRKLDEHCELVHDCTKCGKSFMSLQFHQCQQVGGGRHGFVGPADGEIDESVFKESQVVLKGSIVVYVYENVGEECMVAELMTRLHKPLYKLLSQLVEHFNGIRYSLKIVCDLEEIRFSIPWLDAVISSAFMRITHKNFIDNVILQSISYVIESLNAILERGSSWTVKSISQVQVHVGTYQPINSRGNVTLPLELRGRRGLTNIKTNNCFELSVLCSVYGNEILGDKLRSRIGKPVRDIRGFRSRILSNAKTYEELVNKKMLNFTSITRDSEKGVSVADFDTFEENNPSISINLYFLKAGKVVLLRSTTFDRIHHVNLLQIGCSPHTHYVCINDFGLFVGTGTRNKYIHCPICHKRQPVTKSKIAHKCGNYLQKNVKKISEKNFKFRKLHMLLPASYCLYYKFHYLEISEEKYSRKSTKMAPVAYTLILVARSGVVKHEFYDGPAPMEMLTKQALELAYKVIQTVESTNVPAKLTRSEEERHAAASQCDLCHGEFTATDHKTLHHCHATGAYLGALHNSENLQIKEKPSLSCISFGPKHELKLFLEKATPILSNDPLPISRKNESDVMGLFIERKLRMIKLQNFRPDTAFDTMIGEIDEFPILSSYCIPARVKELARNRKLQMPRFNTEEEWRHALDGGLSEDEFISHLAEKNNESFCVFRNFAGGDFRAYVQLYLDCECLLTADIFETQRKIQFKEYGLELSCAWSMSSFVLDAAFYMERATVELVQDEEMQQIISDSVVAGVTNLTMREAVTNSERFPSTFSPHAPRSEILFCDISANYPSNACGYLPFRNYEFMTREELDNFSFQDPPFDTGKGWLFVVDLEVPKEVHERLSGMPIPPQKRKLDITLLSDSQFDHVKSEGRKIPAEYLLLDFLPKRNISIYYKLLSLSLRLGCKLTNVWRGIKMDEKPLFANFIQHGIRKKNEAKTEAERENMKLALNCLTGRFLLDPSTYNRKKLVRTSNSATRQLASDDFLNFEICGNELVLFDMKKKMGQNLSLKLLGAVVLSNAKYQLYDYIYNHVLPAFDGRMQTVFNHTDSFLGICMDPDQTFIPRLRSLAPIFDFSNLEKDHPLYDTRNAKRPGVFKLVHDGVLEFYGISPCQYSVKLYETNGDEREATKCSGIQKDWARRNLKHKMYKDFIQNVEKQREIFVPTIRYKDGEIIRIEAKRKGIGAICLKRKFISNQLSLPYGDYRIEELDNADKQDSHTAGELLNLIPTRLLKSRIP